MYHPYTDSFEGSFAAAEIALASAVTATAIRASSLSRATKSSLIAAVWIIALGGLIPHFRFVGLCGCAVAAAGVFFVEAPRIARATAAAGLLAMLALPLYLVSSRHEIEAAAMCVVMLVYGVAVRASERGEVPSNAARRADTVGIRRVDIVLAAGAMVLAGLVCTFVLQRWSGSGDEWADTYQADLFAHFRVVGTEPACAESFHQFWVLGHQGKFFAVFAPGWPAVMALFHRLGVVWLAAPFLLGITVAGTARLARRVVSGDPAASEREVRVAGTLAAICVMVGPSMVLNAASRFPHVMVCAAYVWGIEAACALLESTGRARVRWAIVTGSSLALMGTARPSDGVFLSVAPLAWLAYHFFRSRRVGVRDIALIAVGAAAFIVPFVLVLHAQVGRWFVSPYTLMSTTEKVYLLWPHRDEWRWGFPLATGAYSWWPCAPALAVAGSVLARRSGRAPAWMLTVGSLLLASFYVLLTFARNETYNAYGPRFHLPLVPALAVLGAAFLSRLWREPSGWLARSSAIAALAGGTAVVASQVYPGVYSEIWWKAAPLLLAQEAGLHHAAVLSEDYSFEDGHSMNVGQPANAQDTAHNLPSEPNPDLLLLAVVDGAVQKVAPAEAECLLTHYPDRHWYLFDHSKHQLVSFDDDLAAARGVQAPIPPGSETGLISDFEGGTPSVRFGSGWTLFTDKILKTAKSSTGILEVTAPGAHGSRGALSIRGEISDNIMRPRWAGARFFPIQQGVPADLSQRTKLTFWVRGDGQTYSAAMMTERRRKFWLVHEFRAPSEWTQIVLPFAEFHGEAATRYGRTDLRDVMSFFIVATGPSGPFRLEIDDVALE
jgi:hypothetical protein